MNEYDHLKIEKKWQSVWAKKKAYKTGQFVKSGKASAGKKYYVLDMFPYPSGTGLHVGHPKGYIGSDIFARMKRMQGFNVLHPMGYDAFGLPAEQYALEHNISPKKAVEENIKTFEKQLSIIGLSYDWDRRINTTDPDFYHFTQWIFLKIYGSWYNKSTEKAEPIETLVKKFEKSGNIGNSYVNAVTDNTEIFSALEWKSKTEKEKQDILMKYRLAYEGYSEVNWCPGLGTVLANDEILEAPKGLVSERCGFPVEKKMMRQWFLRITAYADMLLTGLDGLNWSEHIKEIQKNFFPWLKSELEKTGVEVLIPSLPNSNDPIVSDQVDYVLKSISFDENTVLVGHSLGGVVAMKILEKLSKPIHGTMLIGCYVENRFLDENFEPHAFDWKFNAQKIKNNAGDITILRDLTDDAVPQDNTYALQQLIGGKLFDYNAKTPHFCGREEPSILENLFDSIKIFTTRPDTIFGATYLVLSPEHELIQKLKSQITNWNEILQYIVVNKNKTEEERVENKEKTGVELKGIKAVNPANGAEIPVWIADYVLVGYGTGAIMAVPAHDERDFEFAKKYNLPIKKVIGANVNDENLLEFPPMSRYSFKKELNIKYDCYEGAWYLTNSGKFTGMPTEKAKKEIVKFVGGKIVTKYKMRDAVFARQRYWGEPIPLRHDKNGIIHKLPEKDLPLILPEVKSYRPTGTGESPLANLSAWVKKGYETNTMPGWAGSSWYFLRYMDPKNKKVFANRSAIEYWKNVDMYVGGAEHTTGHLLYARFFHKILKDYGLTVTEEPFQALHNPGMMLGSDNRKMSKRWGNVVNPDDVVKTYGADTLRVYEMFMGPFEASLPWSTDNIIGSRRFLEKVWRVSRGILDTSPKMSKTVFDTDSRDRK